VGATFSESPQFFVNTHLGVYGLGFALSAMIGVIWSLGGVGRWIALITAIAITESVRHAPTTSWASRRDAADYVQVAGLQLEYPWEGELLQGLDRLKEVYPNVPLVVLSEYSLQDVPSPNLRAWCRRNERHLVVGGRETLSNTNFFNTAFVIDDSGEIEFKQAKSVPIQFFNDGLPAREQSVWHSPWGPIGFAVCYDMNYRRVMDRLVTLGAEVLIVPAVDDSSWGAHEHELHARMTKVRAAEYGLPIFRVAGSGISQIVESDGSEVVRAPYPGEGERLSGTLVFRGKGWLPVDRWIAPACSALAGIIVFGLIVSGLRQAWRRRKERSVHPAAGLGHAGQAPS
jgi:apolipoprotein N-acyltransferase